MRLCFATHNRGKLGELLALLPASAGIEVVSPTDLGLLDQVEETGATFADNAIIKARATHQLAGLPALADDSGLEVDALGGAPGVHSARYGGEPRSDARNLQMLLLALREVPAERRGARFRCTLCLAGDGIEVLRSGVCEGSLIASPRGHNGFGYDPIFVPRPEVVLGLRETAAVRESGQPVEALLGQTLAELPVAVKNLLSHRGRAMAAMAPVLVELAERA